MDDELASSLHQSRLAHVCFILEECNDSSTICVASFELQEINHTVKCGGE